MTRNFDVPRPQLSFATIGADSFHLRTRRREFLEALDEAIPWADVLKVVEPAQDLPATGRRPRPLEVLVRTWILRWLYGLSFRGTADLVADSAAARAFARIDLWHMRPPSAATLQRFDQRLRERGLDVRVRGLVLGHRDLVCGRLREPAWRKPTPGQSPGEVGG